MAPHGVYRTHGEGNENFDTASLDLIIFFNFKWKRNVSEADSAPILR
jgi:hypothetical protein